MNLEPKYDPFDDFDLTVDSANYFGVYKECVECNRRIYSEETSDLCHTDLYYPWFDRWQQEPCCSVHCRSIVEASYKDEEIDEILGTEKKEWIKETRNKTTFLVDWNELKEKIEIGKAEAKADAMEI